MFPDIARVDEAKIIALISHKLHRPLPEYSRIFVNALVGRYRMAMREHADLDIVRDYFLRCEDSLMTGELSEEDSSHDDLFALRETYRYCEAVIVQE
jgi:hypothetical protein